jgi:hypothetical protein
MLSVLNNRAGRPAVGDNSLTKRRNRDFSRGAFVFGTIKIEDVLQ